MAPLAPSLLDRPSGQRVAPPAPAAGARLPLPTPALSRAGGVPGMAAMAGGDVASRIAVMREINESAGNRAAGSFVDAARRHVQRDGQPGSATPSPADTRFTLANARFAGQKRLQDIANGGAALSKSDPAAAVKPVQTALLDLGYSLLRYKDDGRFGDETTQAIAQFRTDRGVVMGDGMDANALRRLDALAPAPGQQEQHYLDYSRLFADGKLDVTLAIGYDEGQTHFADLTSARDWMARMKLVKTASAADQKPAPTPPPGVDVVSGASPIAPDENAATRQGLSVPEVYTGKRTVTYPDKGGTRVTREIAITITLVPPGTGGKASFQKGLQESELMYYSGHARRGIGPDFDKDKSPYENFVIGVGSALHAQGRVQAASAVAQSHYVIDKKNDLEAMKGTWDAEKYRVWFFNACSSIAYFDELRGGLLPEKMDRHNLDLFGTNQEVPIAAGLSPIFANLEGILNGETMEQIVAHMQAASIAALRKVLVDHGIVDEKRQATALREFQSTMFVREGAGDNPVAAKP
jgi:peptidoglycan hydrolase-like protein with peptidoglycan-binding domain